MRRATNLGPQIFSFARCMKEDVKRAIDTGVNGEVNPSSKHMADLATLGRWRAKRDLDRGQPKNAKPRTMSPGFFFPSFRDAGEARGPEIHTPQQGLWIPGSSAFALRASAAARE